MGEVSLKAPETPLYLTLAVQVLDARRKELEDEGPMQPAPAPPSPAPSDAAVAVADAPEAIETAPEEAMSGAQVGSEPETPAIDAFEAGEAVPESGPEAVEAAEAVPAAAPEPAVVEEEPVAALPAPIPPAPAQAGRRARWFRGQFPRVIFEDGSSRVMQSLDELKDLLRSRGLQPHPRGDASMLLWQVRNRLGLSVDQVNA